MHFHHLKYMATPWQKNPCPRSHAIKKNCIPIIGHHYYILNLSESCPEVDKRIFKEKEKLYNFPPKRSPLGVGGHEIYSVLSSYITNATQIYPVVLEKKMLTYDARRTTTDTNA